MYVFTVYASRASPWPLNQHVWISRHYTCFWDGRSCMCNQVQKVWEGRQSVCITLKEFKNVSVSSNRTERKDMVVSQDDHAFYCYARCCCSLSPFSTWTSRHWGYIYALSSPPISRQALSSLLLSQLLPFWHRDNETASTATALRTINLHKCK